jgi:hypothetical protein
VALSALAMAAVISHLALGTLLQSRLTAIWFFDTGVAAIVLVNLVVLRHFGGLRLFSVLPGTAWSPVMIEPSATSDPDLAYVVTAWPQLPVGVRGAATELVRATQNRNPS